MSASPDEVDQPTVSVIIPVYNTRAYLAQALDSALMQDLGPGGLEILVVDDGSTDGSGELIDQYATRHAEVTAIHLPRSGGPGAPRNAALEVARGRYVFFLDADDELTPDSLRDLVRYADEHGSDIVLGKMGGLGGRRPPSTMFGRSVQDADVISDRLLRTLGPCKLFRRDLIERHRLRFPAHLTRHEDPPFVLAAYLLAAKTSVRADRVYHLVRDRADGSNLTKQAPSAGEAWVQAQALLDVIESCTEPGRLRDDLMWRPIHFNVIDLVGPRFLELDEPDKQVLLEQFSDRCRPLMTAAAWQHVHGLLETKMRVALDRDVEALTRLIEWEIATPTGRIRSGTDRFVLALPEQLHCIVGAERVAAPVARIDAELVGLATRPGAVDITATVLVADLAGPLTTTPVLRLSRRHAEQQLDLPATVLAAPAQSGPATRVEVTVPVAELTPGIWDVSLVLWAGQHEVTRRLGAQRDAAVPEGLRPVADPSSSGALARPLALVYFTEGFGNLSVDVGLTLPKHAAPAATLLGVAGGSAVLQWSGPGPVSFHTGGDAPIALDAEPMSQGVVSVLLPTDLDPRTDTLLVSGVTGTSAVNPAADLVLPSPPVATAPTQPEPAPRRGLRGLRDRLG